MALVRDRRLPKVSWLRLEPGSGSPFNPVTLANHHDFSQPVFSPVKCSNDVWVMVAVPPCEVWVVLAVPVWSTGSVGSTSFCGYED